MHVGHLEPYFKKMSTADYEVNANDKGEMDYDANCKTITI